MSTALPASSDLGLQHVLQNGIKLIRKESFDPERRDSVLESLINIFSEADRGSAALTSHNLMFAVDEPPAFERFALFFEYLKDTLDDVPSHVTQAKNVLQSLRRGQTLDSSQAAELEGLLTQLLEALRRERARAPLIAPKEFLYT
jgi:hypothetical protein